MIKLGVEVIFPDEEEVIDQNEKVKEETAKHLSQMGWLFDKVHEKLGTDSVCFKCKKKIKKGEEMKLTNVAGTEKGLIAFVALCPICVKEYEKDVEE